MAYTLNLGFDRGNSRTNVAALNELGNVVEFDFSSMIAEGNLRKYQNMLKGSGMDQSGNEMTVDYGDTVYFLADLAESGINPTTGFKDKNRYHSKHTKVSIMASAYLMAKKLWPAYAGQDLAINLVMGVPIKAFQEESERIQQELPGVYQFEYNGHSATIRIETVKVFMEGAGAAVQAGLEKNSTVGIIDSGSLTTNILWFDGPKANAEKCDSFEIGVETALVRLSNKFEEKYGRDLSHTERQEILRASIGQFPYPEIYVDGRQASGNDLHAWMLESLREVGNDRNARISALWSRENGKVASSFKKVLHVGGGSYYFHTTLRGIIPHAIAVVDGEKANARGYAIIAHQVGKRKMMTKGA
jgi:hypothetical protein